MKYFIPSALPGSEMNPPFLGSMFVSLSCSPAASFPTLKNEPAEIFKLEAICNWSTVPLFSTVLIFSVIVKII